MKYKQGYNVGKALQIANESKSENCIVANVSATAFCAIAKIPRKKLLVLVKYVMLQSMCYILG